MAEKEKKLTPKQRIFIAEYVNCYNATEAARRAGYSEKTAYKIGSENLKKPQIFKQIQAVIDERLAITKQSLPERIIREHERLAFSDITKYNEQTEAIQSVEFDETGKTKKVRMYNKGASLDSLAKICGLQNDSQISITQNNLIATLPAIEEKDVSAELPPIEEE
jgi:phage terminase small subunit